ncbi:MAG: DUF2189 domain-containing protein [Burkholderiales bacterium]|nr:DUF2189 domain-containing protein [Burkholderiales bacterium]
MARGGRDFIACRWVSAAHGVAVAVFGALLFWLAHDRFWLLAGAFSGFLVVAPVFATGLYALSRALERGEPADMALLLRTWTHWGTHRRSDPGSYWCLVRFGLLLALAGTGWVLTSAAFITVFAPVPIVRPEDFIRHVVIAPDHFVFEAWLAMGGLLAAPVFASSVIAMPLLLDRHVNALQAVLASWRVVLANPMPMALWAAMLMMFTFCGFVTALLAMVAIVPILGHASWHAYRDLLDVSDVPERVAPGGTASNPAGAAQ